jgi:SAM-dependent methyltransferase
MRTAAPTVSDPTALHRLRTQLSGRLQPLDPVEYAAGHALFEARSDQRALLTSWLAARLARRADGPTAVLSIGCGDGSVDAPLAAVLAARGAVEYLGVEPHAPSGAAFLERLGALHGVRAEVVAAPFAQLPAVSPRDVVLAVHSLYYVADLGTALRRAVDLLGPGGELLVLHAPLEPLNALVRELAPGRWQEFSAEVLDVLRGQGRRPEVERIDAVLDLSPTGDRETDRLLLDFTVQAQVPPPLTAAVRAALAERALPGPGLVLSHPVDAIVVTA